MINDACLAFLYLQSLETLGLPRAAQGFVNGSGTRLRLPTFFNIGLKCSFLQSMFEILVCLWGMHKRNIVLIMIIQIGNIFFKKQMEKENNNLSTLISSCKLFEQSRYSYKKHTFINK